MFISFKGSRSICLTGDLDIEELNALRHKSFAIILITNKRAELSVLNQAYD